MNHEHGVCSSIDTTFNHMIFKTSFVQILACGASMEGEINI
jgi:hypothetical protein